MTAALNVWAVFRREMGSYFLSPMAYIVLFVFLLVNGALFCVFSYTSAGHPQQITVIIEDLFQFSIWLLPLLTPVLTMRLFAEEKRTGSLELLMTAPVREVEVVLGKYFAAQGFYAVVWLSLAPLLGILAVLGDPDWGPVIAVYFGLFSLGFLLNSIGVLASAGTRNQLVAAVVALSGNLFFLLLTMLGTFFQGDVEVRRLVQYVSFRWHFLLDYLRGVVDLRYLAFYLSFAALFLFFSVRVLEARKWR